MGIKEAIHELAERLEEKMEARFSQFQAWQWKAISVLVFGLIGGAVTFAWFASKDHYALQTLIQSEIKTQGALHELKAKTSQLETTVQKYTPMQSAQIQHETKPTL